MGSRKSPEYYIVIRVMPLSYSIAVKLWWLAVEWSLREVAGVMVAVTSTVKFEFNDSYVVE
jgi:hypothetical protein